MGKFKKWWDNYKQLEKEEENKRIEKEDEEYNKEVVNAQSSPSSPPFPLSPIPT